MTPPNAAALYAGNRINTASPAELTLMLYDGAIKFCNMAIDGLENNDIQKANTNLIKAQKIIVEFDEGADAAAVMKQVAAACKKVEDDCEIYL